MEATELNAVPRTETGKGPARRFRTEGMIPAVFYGRGDKAVPITVNAADLMKVIKARKENIFIKLLIKGDRKRKLSLLKELQIEPVSRCLYHADFYEIQMDHKLTLDVPIHFIGIPIGVDNGGELQHLKRDLKVSCLPGDLPDFIELDVTGLEIGHSIKVQDIPVPAAVTVLDPGDVGVAMVAVIKVSVPKTEAETAEGEAAAEGETTEKAEPAPKGGAKG